MKITLRQLSLFIEIAKQENLSKAADKQFISQSAASMALFELENRLGINLFDRAGKKLVLNAHGKALLPKAVEITERVKEIENISYFSAPKLTGHLKIGASSTIGNYLLPQLIINFKKANPEVQIDLMVSNTQEIIYKLASFELDIGFIEANCNEAELIIKPWKKDELIIFASKKHPLVQKKQIFKRDLQNADWIIREKGSGTRTIFEKAMQSLIESPRIYLELGSTEAIKQAVTNSYAISCASKFTIANELKSGELVALPIKNLSITRNLFQLIHKQKYSTPLLQAFLSEKC